VKVTRIAYSKGLNEGKYGQLGEQASRLGRVRSLVWRQYGSIAGLGVSDRQVRDQWMSDGTATGFGVLANPWKETLRDAMADIKAHREAAKVKVRRAIAKRKITQTEKKRLYQLLKRDQWTSERYLSRMMRKHWRRGRNKTSNQIVVRADQYRTWTLTDGGDVWLAIPGLTRRSMIAIPLNTTVAPTGTLRVILRYGRAEVHYAIDADTMTSSQRPCGDAKLGVDKGYTEVLTDSAGNHHGPELGDLLTPESDYLKIKNKRRAKIRSVANKAREAADHAKADRIVVNNLGGIKRSRRRRRFESRVRSVTFAAIHQVFDRAAHVVTEDLTRSFASRKKLGKNTNRRLAAWTKGVTAEALASVSERRGSVLTLVNAAYTSQVVPCCRTLGRRCGDRLYCTEPGCGAVWQADHAAAINVLERDGDPDISLYTKHTLVKQIIQERADRRRTRLPVQDSSSTGGERTIQPRSTSSNEKEAGQRCPR
jgi:hypothetical protein